MADTLKRLVEAYLLHVVTQQCDLGAKVIFGPIDDGAIVPPRTFSSATIRAMLITALQRLDRVVEVEEVFDVGVDVKPIGHVVLTVTRK